MRLTNRSYAIFERDQPVRTFSVRFFSESGIKIHLWDHEQLTNNRDTTASQQGGFSMAKAYCAGSLDFPHGGCQSIDMYTGGSQDDDHRRAD